MSYIFAVEMGHFDMMRWKYESVCIFSMLRDTLELILWKKADKKCKSQKRSIFSRRMLWQMGWRTRASALLIRNLRQIAYLLLMWDGIWSGAVFLWRRLICPQNNSLRMFWCRDLNSSHFFPRFGVLEHTANKTPDISATFIGSHKKFCKRKRMSVCSVRKRSRGVLSVSLL